MVVCVCEGGERRESKSNHFKYLFHIENSMCHVPWDWARHQACFSHAIWFLEEEQGRGGEAPTFTSVCTAQFSRHMKL